jgi:hypothetical protein
MYPRRFRAECPRAKLATDQRGRSSSPRKSKNMRGSPE